MESTAVAILKIAPKKDVRIMTHEKNIMSSEVQAMRTVAQSGTIPVPQIYGYDDSSTLCDSPYFFMEKLKGSSLDTIKDTLTQEQIENIYIETGKIICAVNHILPISHFSEGMDWKCSVISSQEEHCGMISTL